MFRTSVGSLLPLPWTSAASLQKSLAKEKGGEVSDAMMEEFKSLVTEVLTPHASAIVLDPGVGTAGFQAPGQECRIAAGL